MPESLADTVGGKIFTFGSYRLGALISYTHTFENTLEIGIAYKFWKYMHQNCMNILEINLEMHQNCINILEIQLEMHSALCTRIAVGSYRLDALA